MRIDLQRVAFLVLIAASAAVPWLRAPAVSPIETPFPGWPTHFEGRALRALPLSAVEERFAAGFPGRLARFSDGRREIVMRWVADETRKLHPAAECFRANGYSIEPLPLARDAAGELWSGFIASRGSSVLTVRESIIDAAGRRWSDVSAWYWAAAREQTTGPWWAVTIAERGPEPSRK